jgi:hypothetical protein
VRKIILPFLSTAIILMVATEKDFGQDLWLGIKGGLSIPNLSSGSSGNPVSTGYSSRLGPDFGAYVQRKFNSRFSIVVQLEYSSQGGQKNGEQAFATPSQYQAFFPTGEAPEYLYANYKSVAKLNYLMLPILVRYDLPLGDKLGVYGAVGPFVSALVSAKNVTSGSSEIYADQAETEPLTQSPQSFASSQDIKSELHQFDGGISGFVGFSYLLGTGKIFIEGGGNYGLFNIQKYTSDGKNNTGAGVVTVGYTIGLGK